MSIGEIAPAGNWVAVTIGILGLVMSYVQSRDRLPSWARKWLARIGKSNVEAAVAYAAKLSPLTPEEKRREAAAYLSRLAQKELGFPIPTSVANLLVEYVYQRFKRR